MVRTQASPLRIALTNTLGAFGYISVLLQWLWFALTALLPFLIQTEAVTFFMPTPDATQPTVPEPSDGFISQAAALVIIGVAVIFSLAVSIYAIYRVPKSIAQTGKKISRRSAEITVHHVAKQKKYTPAKQRRLTINTTWIMKLLFATIPMLLLLAPIYGQSTLPYNVVIAVGLFCGICSWLWFGAQYVLMRLLHIRSSLVW